MIVSISQAVEILNSQKVVAMPTETVYGLAGDATSDLAVARIFETKERPEFNPLIIHIWDIAQIELIGTFSPAAQVLAKAFWPGPLTLVIPLHPTSPLSKLAGAGLNTIAVRMPHHPVALELLRLFRNPLAAPSANKSGRISPTESSHVGLSLGSHVPVLEGGRCIVGLESTIVDVSSEIPYLLRHGAILKDQMEALLDQPIMDKTVPEKGGKILSPGQMLSHYAPRLPLRMNVMTPHPTEAFLGFGLTENATLNLSPIGHLTEAAANLFSMLHTLDRPSYRGIAVAPIPQTGLGLAINDRLKRAAAPKGIS